VRREIPNVEPSRAAMFVLWDPYPRCSSRSCWTRVAESARAPTTPAIAVTDIQDDWREAVRTCSCHRRSGCWQGPFLPIPPQCPSLRVSATAFSTLAISF